ncbi:MAG: phage tail tape measure protein [Bacteroidales bacterium]|nr:phage tail tape measure protein [Bacteroidales bacterium]
MSTRDLYFNIIGKDKMSSTMNSINGASLKTEASLGRVSSQSNTLKANIRGAANEIPVLGAGLRFLTNPLAMAAGGVALLAAGFNGAANEAAKFNSTFRELKNLNLDKSAQQIKDLKSDVLGLSAEKGFDPFQTSRGFYDIQSVTGKFGQEVKQIVSKQGEFANVFQADFNKWIEGTGKAMANYGFKADKLDEFNRSAYATVNVGSITFDELARLQAVYAGAAASAKQSFNSANQLMTMFTVKTEKANEAATMTKSAFIDLFKETTVKAFTKAGVDMYDKVTGKARQVSDIMIDLHKKFMQTKNDLALDNLRNQFAGSEGLNMLIQTAADKSGNFLRTLDQFDKVDFNFNKALKEANEDITLLQQKTENLLATSKIQLGEELLPWKLKWVQFSLEFMQKVNMLVNGREAAADYIKRGQVGEVRAEYNDKLAKAHIMSKDDFENNQSELVAKYQNALGMRNAYKSPADFHEKVNGGGIRMPGDAKFSEYTSRWQSVADEYKKYIQQFPEYRSHPELNPFKSTKSEVDGNAAGTEGADGKLTQGISDISGGGAKQTNITISIGKLMEAININTTNLSESAPEIEERMTEILMRSLNGSAQLSNN